ncbi:hypothetical protein KUTeg_013055 [Tegillarca granosa]|uniref:RING-type E3 ubiquitin transferase n=1 Tax=Tegillarca granosa TaxID=220873 RepID=A0ABQ9ESK8_TEGGR|nr:hypothetical protein KUTeg_013055 [Tegillarca granosa]
MLLRYKPELGTLLNLHLISLTLMTSVIKQLKSYLFQALYVQAFVCVILTGKLMRKIFFGQLRAAEIEHLIEKSWYAVTETCLAFTVFRDDFSPKFVALFTLLLFLKCFHWLAEDRIDYMERSPVISVLFHFRALSLIALLGILDLYFVNHAYYSTILKGASVQLVFGFEYAILLTAVMMIIMKYILHTIDLQNENPWENKAVYLLYTELVLGFIKVVLYFLFMAIMIKVHTFPLFAIRPMYLSMRSFKKALHDVIMSRRAIRNMNTLYPDATTEELQAGDNVCIICREEMMTNSKKLPCNHIFHTSCLRSWFQRQQTCPTCRMDVLRMPRPQTPTPQPPQQPPQQPQMPPNMFGGFHGMPQMWPQPPPPQPPQTPTSSSSTRAASGTSTAPTATVTSTFTHPTTSTAAGASAMQMPPYMPMFPFMAPFSPSPKAETATESSVPDNSRSTTENTIPVSTLSSVPPQGTGGARPKYSSPLSKSNSSTTTNMNTNNSNTAVKGATGYTPVVKTTDTDEIIPDWEDPNKEEHEDEMHEVRRRRLQRFEQDKNDNTTEDN